MFEIQEKIGSEWRTMIGSYGTIDDATKDLNDLIRDTGYDRRCFRIHCNG